MKAARGSMEGGGGMERDRLLAALNELLTGAPKSARRVQRLHEELFREIDRLIEIFERLVNIHRSGVIPELQPCLRELDVRRREIPIARDLVVRACDNGDFEFDFHVDSYVLGGPLHLGPQVGGLLSFLAEAAPAKNGLVGWRENAEVFAYIKSISATGNARKFTNELVHRLRGILADIGLPKTMIQRNKQLGIRFSSVPPKRDR
jgi:hypothetical protein